MKRFICLHQCGEDLSKQPIALDHSQKHSGSNNYSDYLDDSGNRGRMVVELVLMDTVMVFM